LPRQSNHKRTLPLNAAKYNDAFLQTVIITISQIKILSTGAFCAGIVVLCAFEAVERAAEGEPFIIAKSGRPLVVVNSYIPAEPSRRTGFLKGRASVPDDFDSMGGSG
jgi:hypothetical protein